MFENIKYVTIYHYLHNYSVPAILCSFILRAFSQSCSASNCDCFPHFLLLCNKYDKQFGGYARIVTNSKKVLAINDVVRS